MDIFDVLVEQADDKITQLKDYLAQGRAETFEEYKALCGEIKGLLIARGNVLDLKQKAENADD
jgi:hypothetical protein